MFIGNLLNQEILKNPPVQIGDIITLRIEGLAAGGDFIGRHGPFAVFVSGGAPAETARVEITEVSPKFARGRVVAIEKPSPDRVEPLCLHTESCGGCDMQHIYYPAQLAHKTLLVRETLKRIGRMENISMPPAIGMEEPWAYRNKAEYFAARDEVGHIFLGFMKRNTHDVTPISGCAVQHPLNERIRKAVEELVNTHAQGAEEKNTLIQVISRVSFAQEKACVTFVTFGKPGYIVPLAHALIEAVPEVSGVCHSSARSRHTTHRSPAELVAGSPYLMERIGSFSYRISPDSFFQVNPRQTLALVKTVEKYAAITDEEIVIEGYSGVGTFLIPLAKQARMATGIEASESAVADAKANIKKLHLENTRIYLGDVERILPNFAQKKWHAGAVVLDPPRAGCGKAVLAAAAQLQPRVIVIVSCDPATLARDLGFAATLGYKTREVQIVDMFPHTWHTESIAVCAQ